MKSHGQKIDGKNMMHCRRLLEMGKEIGLGMGIKVRRPNAKYLLDIRSGLVDLQSLINSASSDITEIDNLFKNSNLPEKVDEKFINDLLIKIRKKIYNL